MCTRFVSYFSLFQALISQTYKKTCFLNAIQQDECQGLPCKQCPRSRETSPLIVPQQAVPQVTYFFIKNTHIHMLPLWTETTNKQTKKHKNNNGKKYTQRLWRKGGGGEGGGNREGEREVHTHQTHTYSQTQMPSQRHRQTEKERERGRQKERERGRQRQTKQDKDRDMYTRTPHMYTLTNTPA